MSDETKPEHPAPWRWEASVLGEETSSPWLVDGTGATILTPNTDEEITIASPLARELIRLAPEMEQSLRDLKDVFDVAKASVDRGDWGNTETVRRVVAVLATLDAARNTP